MQTQKASRNFYYKYGTESWSITTNCLIANCKGYYGLHFLPQDGTWSKSKSKRSGGLWIWVLSQFLYIELADGRTVCHHLDHICSCTVPHSSSVYKKCMIKWWQCNSACLWISLLSLVIYWTSQLYVPWDPSVDITAGLLFAPHHLLATPVQLDC